MRFPILPRSAKWFKCEKEYSFYEYCKIGYLFFLQGGCHDSESYKFKISQNGYEIIRGARLKELFRAIDNLNAPDIDVGSISNRASQISLFDFKAFLNSESAISPIFPTVSYFI